MDFGDILSQWDSMSKKPAKKVQDQKSHKKANAPTKDEKARAQENRTWEKIMEEDNSRQANPMTVWLNRFGTVDKDKLEMESEETRKYSNINYLRSMAPQATIDLHGMTRDQAWLRLEGFVAQSVRAGYKKIMIIHGKGNHSNGSDPVLGPMVKSFIEQSKFLGTSGHPDRNHGGNGATWVIVK